MIVDSPFFGRHNPFNLLRAALGGGVPPMGAIFTVLNAVATVFICSRTVRDEDANEFTVSATVRDEDGNPFNVT